MSVIGTIEELEAIYGAPVAAARVKELDHLNADYRALIEASPFVVLATAGPEGLDCSPRGDSAPVVHIADERTLMLPDRKGNNRIDSLRNIVRDPRVALLFLIPGSGTTFRVNGQARIETGPELLERFAVEGQRPRSVVVICVERAYFKCARAVLRSGLWEETAKAGAAGLTTPGRMLARVSDGSVGGEAYDRDWPERARKTLW